VSHFGAASASKPAAPPAIDGVTAIRVALKMTP